MAQGSFTDFDKIRPGAYVRFMATRTDADMLGANGIVATVLPLAWGDDIVRLTADDVRGGRTLELTGYAMGAPELVSVQKALENAREVVIVRGDSGSTKATAAISSVLTASAKYGGVLGNGITVTIESFGDSFVVITALNGTEVARSVGSTAEEIEDNIYVDFTGTGELSEQAATALEGGSNGTVGGWSEAVEEVIGGLNYDVIVMTNPSNLVDFEKFLKGEHDAGRYRTGVAVGTYSSDSDDGNFEGLVKIDEAQYPALARYPNGTEHSLTAGEVAHWAAGLYAGTSINRGNTYAVVPHVVELEKAYNDEETIARLNKGFFLLTYRRDGAVVVEQDINSLHIFSSMRTRAYSKNRTMRTLVYIQEYIADLFETGYIGKVNANEHGRSALSGDIVAFMMRLSDEGAIRNFNISEDISIRMGAEPDTIIVDLFVQPMDSLEKLYLTINTRV